MPPWWQGDLLLCECLYFVSNHIDPAGSSLDSRFLVGARYTHTVRQTRSAPGPLPCMRRQEADEQDNGCLLFFLSQAFPKCRDWELVRWFAKELTEMMIWGQLPSFAITLRRSMVSTLPTTSSRIFGLYFSTLSYYNQRCRPKIPSTHTMAAHMEFLRPESRWQWAKTWWRRVKSHGCHGKCQCSSLDNCAWLSHSKQIYILFVPAMPSWCECWARWRRQY